MTTLLLVLVLVVMLVPVFNLVSTRRGENLLLGSTMELKLAEGRRGRSGHWRGDV